MQKKSKNRKRLLSGILCFVMVFSLGLEMNGLTALAASEAESTVQTKTQQITEKIGKNAKRNAAAPMATITVSTWAEMRLEIEGASGPVDITLGSDIAWGDGDNYIVLTDGKVVTLHLDGHNITGRQDTTGASTYEYALFEVDQSAELTIDGNGTLTSNKAGYGIVYVKGGTFNMAGGTITGNNYGAGVVLYGGTFRMSGNAEITQNKAPSQSGNGGGGVEVTNGSFTMNGGSIHDNTAEKTGGGVWLYGDCSFTMTYGDIYNNTAYDGGGVFFYGTGTNSFTMSGGKIHGNTVKYTSSNSNGRGGGVYIEGNSSNTTFDMSNGEIYDNHADSSGGGVCIYNKAVFNLSGGTIHNNEVTNDTIGNGSGGGVSIDGNTGSNSILMTGGTISENKAHSNGGGLFIASRASMCALRGGSITGNHLINEIQNGGGVYVGGANMTLSGNIRITDNTGKTNAANNLHLSFGSSRTVLLDQALGADAKVGVHWSYGSRYFAEPASGYVITEEDASKFNADQSGFVVEFGYTADGVKENKLILHQHSYDGTYTINGNKITKKCVQTEPFCKLHLIGISASVTAEDADYTGQPYTGVNVTKDDGFTETVKLGYLQLESDGTYTSLSGAPTVPGSYRAKISTYTTGSKYAYDSFVIKRRMITITPPTPQDETYDGKSKTGYTGSATFEPAWTGSPDVTYYLADGNTKTTAENSGAAGEGLAPKYAGDYKIIFSIPASDKINTGSATISFKINKKKIDVPAANTSEYIYDGTTQTYTLAANSAYKLENNTRKDAGSQEVTVTLTDTKNTEWKDTLPLYNFIIKQKGITVVITPNGGIFEGQITPAQAVLKNVESVDAGKVPVTLIYMGTSNDGTKVYNGTEVPAKAGKYTVTASIANDNYNLTGTTSAAFAVDKADAGLTVNAVTDKVYKDPAFNLEVTKKSDGALSYESSDTKVLTVDKDGKVTIVGAGNATITVSVAEAANYKADKKTVGVTVKRKDGTLTVTEMIYNVTYGDASFKIGTITSEGESAIQYESSDNKVVTVDAAGNVNINGVGQATVNLTMAESDNYNKTETSVEVKVAPKAITVTAEDKTKTYGEKDETLTWKANGLVGNDTLTGITAKRESGEDVAEYGISLTQKEGSNPNYEVKFEKGTYKITPKDIKDAVVTLGTALIDNGQEQTQDITSVTVKNSLGESMDVVYDVADNKGIKAGAYTMTLTGTGNYTGTTTKDFVIAPSADTPLEEDKEGNVVIGGGTIGFVVETAPEAPTTTLETEKATMIEMLTKNDDLTSNELAMVAEGAAIDVILKVTDASDIISADAKNQIEKAGDYTVGQYVDISLFKQLVYEDGQKEDPTKLDTTSQKVQLTIKVPDQLLNKDANVTRTFSLVRNYNGKVETMAVTYDAKTHTLSFATDKFTDYAIVYKDTTVKTDTTDKTESAPSDTLSLLLAKGTSVQQSVKLTWLKEKKATGYEVYWTYCNGKQNYKKLAATKKLSFTTKKLNRKKEYKYYVKSYRMVAGKKQYISKSPAIHVAMKYSKLTNVKSIHVNSGNITLKVQRTTKINATYKKMVGRKRLLLHTAKFRYYTTNKGVATVSSKGIIKGKAKGSCSVYVIANNGVYKKIKVTVK